ncbi:hypothetical protein KCP78_18940 [Salmonella enterica subsp. enterica]|nr:hypothetical protein KCP78_18940 [Salmonella enterica subsp. enterica]
MAVPRPHLHDAVFKTFLPSDTARIFSHSPSPFAKNTLRSDDAGKTGAPDKVFIGVKRTYAFYSDVLLVAKNV